MDWLFRLWMRRPLFMTRKVQANARKTDKFVVRFPYGMRDRISSSAEKGRRSMNSDIIFRLSRSIGEKSSSPAAGESNVLSAVEMRLLKNYREMSGNRRQALLQMLTED
jgi:hypothetical protein